MFYVKHKSKLPEFTHTLQTEPSELLGRPAELVESTFRRGDDWSVEHSAMVYVDDVRYHIQVTQHGKGTGALLSEEEIEKIFSSFKRLNEAKLSSDSADLDRENQLDSQTSTSQQRDYDRIQGSWQVVAQEKDNQIRNGNSNRLMQVDGWTMRIQSPGRADSTWLLSLDTASTPNEFDMFASDQAVDPAFRGVYRVDGDKLTIRLAGRGVDRPRNLSTNEGDKTTMYVFERVRSGTAPAAESSSRKILDQIVACYGGSAGKIDHPRAAELIRELADAGDPLGRMWLARSLFKGRCGFDEDSQKAQQIAREVIGTVQQRARQGDSHALFLLASGLADGLGTKPDEKQSEQLYRVAAKQGHSIAAYNLAVVYKQSDQDAAAGQWMSRAAEAGNAEAMNNLGAYYHNGEMGFPVSKRKAQWWYEQSADAGLDLAEENLATLQSRGRNRVSVQPYAGFGQVGNYYGSGTQQSRFSGPGWDEDARYREYQSRQLQFDHMRRLNNVLPGVQLIPRSALGLRP